MLPPIQPSPGEVVVAETGSGRFAQEVRVGRHMLAADEPLLAGGDDSGPGPYDYLLAALGACTAMTVRLVARRRGLPLIRVAVRLRHNRRHAGDCADCEDHPQRLDHVEMEVMLDGPLDESQRAYLLGVAMKCPVHRTLDAGVHMDMQLVVS
ncbi:MAG TPA: OsmC family protein [Patescibacteria group bacterium]|nr:OsmC family protein [Patescibacteria group bacterium]